jgi:23S rRNA (uracil1939-C5)-methyltransferase
MKNNNYRKKVTQERLKVKCLYLNHDGRGVVTYNKRQIPVSFLLEGEEALIDFTDRGKYVDTKIQSVIERSKHRTTPTCPYYYDCGGCQLQHMSYEHQVEYKENLVKKLLPEYKVSKMIKMDHPYAYRNKTIASFSMNNKNVVSGFYKMNSHEVVPIENCEVQIPEADKILKTIRYLCEKHKIQIFNEDTHNGFLRHVLIKTAYKTGEVLVTFVVSTKIFASKAKLLKGLLEAHPEIKSVTMNINPNKTSVVLGKDEIVLYGDGKIKDELCGYDFKISSQSFYQVNPVQTEKLYEEAMKLADIQKDEIVLDTYCGIGTIGIIASKYAKEVYGVEVNKEAVKDAISNAKMNKIKNIRFVQSDATYAMGEMVKEDFKIDVLFLDPPREGSTDAFIDATLKLKPKKIVYISCNPETLARDLKLFTKKHYKVTNVIPVDMFPHSTHVETIVQLRRVIR